MTREEFDTAVESILHAAAPGDDRGSDKRARVIAASGFVMKRRQGVPDNVTWGLSLSDVPEFLSGLSRRQRRLLKEMAEDLVMNSEQIH